MRFKLLRKDKEVGDVTSFVFEPEQPVSWVAGQYMRVELDHEGDPEDRLEFEHWFTISAPPYEKHPAITTHVSQSTFKQALDHIPIGGEITVDGIEGDFIWRESALPLVFIAGGIGITPVHSILKQRVYDNEPVPAILVYANKERDVVFGDEIEHWRMSHPELKVHYVIGERLTPEKCHELVPGLNASQVYITGPQGMVDAIGVGLMKAGLEESQLTRDWFPGYTDY
ncbi:MAG TPA: FAD-dependent oxidoreductase [Candidatus Saccharimonadales bacterium]|nr:FAD-dependent oxidoreductase [Candidatus Saccharimonadales bacterium]